MTAILPPQALPAEDDMGAGCALSHRLTIQVGRTQVGLLRFAPRGERLLIDTVGRSSGWWPLQAGTRPQPLLRHPTSEDRLILSPSGKLGITGCGSAALWLWRMQDARRLRCYHASHGAIPAAAISLNDALLAGGGSDGTLTIWSVLGDLFVRRHAHQGSVSALAWLPDGRLFSTGSDCTLVVWDALAGRPLQSIATTAPICTLIPSPDGAWIATPGGSVDSAASVWRSDTWSPAARLTPTAGTATTLAWSPDGALLAVGDTAGGVQVWDWCAGRAEPCATVQLDQPIAALAFGPGGRLLAAGGIAGQVQIWTVGGGRQRPA